MNRGWRLAVLFPILLSTTVYAVPDWYVNDYADEYASYFIGKGSAKIEDGNEAEAEKRAKDEALRDASTTICCRVSGETISRLSEERVGKEISVTDYALSETQVRTDMEVMNYQVLESEEDRGFVYVMIGIPGEDLRKSYRYRISTAIQNIAGDFELAEKLRASDPNQAIRKYAACIKMLQDVTDNMMIYLFLNQWQDDLSKEKADLPEKPEIEQRLTELSGIVPKTSVELANELLVPLLENTRKSAAFVIYPLEFGNTGFVSDFGYTFTEVLTSRISAQSRWQRYDYKRQKSADYIFRGKLLESEQGIYLVLDRKDGHRGNVASNQVFVNSITCDHMGWNRIRPKDLKQALENKLALYDAIQRDNRLKVDLQTEKMADGPVTYRYEEEPKLVVRANKPCYVRLMYIFSDDTKTLLLDNYSIPMHLANQWVPVPLELEVCEPSGIEQMLVQASTERMPSLSVKRVDLGGNSYIHVIESGIGEQIAKTRGVKLKTPEKEITERVYQWTVFEK